MTLRLYIRAVNDYANYDDNCLSFLDESGVNKIELTVSGKATDKQAPEPGVSLDDKTAADEPQAGSWGVAMTIGVRERFG